MMKKILILSLMIVIFLFLVSCSQISNFAGKATAGGSSVTGKNGVKSVIKGTELQPCTDTDGGINFFIKGTTTGLQRNVTNNGDIISVSKTVNDSYQSLLGVNAEHPDINYVRACAGTYC